MNKILRIISYIVLVLVIVVSALFFTVEKKKIGWRNEVIEEISMAKAEHERLQAEKERVEEEQKRQNEMSEDDEEPEEGILEDEYYVIIDSLPIYDSIEQFGDKTPAFLMDYGSDLSLVDVDGCIAKVKYSDGTQSDLEGYTLIDCLVPDYDDKYEQWKAIAIDFSIDNNAEEIDRSVNVDDYMSYVESQLRTALNDRGLIPIFLYPDDLKLDDERYAGLLEAFAPEAFLRISVSCDLNKPEKKGCSVSYADNDNIDGKVLGETLLNAYSEQTQIEKVQNEKKQVSATADYEELNVLTCPAVVAYLGYWSNDDDYNNMVEEDVIDKDVIEGLAKGIQKFAEDNKKNDIETKETDANSDSKKNQDEDTPVLDEKIDADSEDENDIISLE